MEDKNQFVQFLSSNPNTTESNTIGEKELLMMMP